MDYNLETWKGSCGYASPGRTGIQGEDGNSIHFSSIDTSINSTTDLIQERILNNQSLSDNTEAITEEKYKVNDYILDTYGQLSVITSITSNAVTRSPIGNIAFSKKTQGYVVPVDRDSDKAELKFIIDNSLQYPPYTKYNDTEYENAFIQREQLKDPEEWKLWRYRYHGHKSYNGVLNVPRGYLVYPDADASVLVGKDDNGEDVSYQSSKDFITHVVDNKEYCKICAVLNNGLVIESIPSEDNSYSIFIEKGYIESIDKNLTSLQEYTTFEDELNGSVNDSSIKEAIKSGQPSSMCKMYFEYSHNGELYRMNINVS